MIQGHDPRTGKPVGVAVQPDTASGVAGVVEAAAAAAPAWRTAARAAVLEDVAGAIADAADELWPLADAETALGETRLRGEIARTAGQFRMFARVLRDGGHVEAIIDHADPASAPPRPDVRRMLHPVHGVVAVFAASNFPFAFSVAGGDTASALAAGCPVVVKAHEGHPGTSIRVAEIVRSALPDPALLGLVHGVDAGRALVQHPRVAAVGFTGSLRGGRALYDLAASRPDPIPFYGELGSVNPVVVLPGAVDTEDKAKAVASGFTGSLTLGGGQFCTNPGLIFIPSGSPAPAALEAAVTASTGAPMLSERIRDGYLAGVSRLSALHSPASGTMGEGAWATEPRLFTIDLAGFADGLPELAEECFGPAAIAVTYSDPADLPGVLSRLPGSLTASLHAGPSDSPSPIAAVLTRVAGRVIWAGWPTGVAVTWAMHHGGPWPATTAPGHTSVGATAIRRWQAPVSYQDWPDDLLPLELREDNPLGISRRVDGSL